MVCIKSVCKLHTFFIIVKRNRQYEDIIPLLFWLLGIIGLAVIYSEISLPIVNQKIGRGISCFFSGAVLAVINRRAEEKKLTKVANILVVFLVAVGLMTALRGYGVLGDVRLFVIICFGPVIILGSIYNKFFKKVLGLMSVLGKYSLAIFVWHFPVQVLLKLIAQILWIDLDFSTHIAWFLYVLITTVVAIIYERANIFMANHVR